MLMDRLIAALALAIFTGFLLILVLRVPRADLIIVVLIGIVLAGYDFYSASRKKR